MGDVFRTFLQLGLTSFGGPIAHLGYFRREFVQRRGWLDEALFTQIVAFCSILPGPTSSQVGMIIGLLRAGPGGALAAWLGFTLPSAIALTAFAAFLALTRSAGTHATTALAGLLAGLGAAATAIVAQAVLGMLKTQCTDRATQTIAAAAAALALALAAWPAWQWVPIAAGALAGAVCFLRTASGAAAPATGSPLILPRTAPPPAAMLFVPPVAAATLFVALVAAGAVVSGWSPVGYLLATIVRAGSLVFGGGHVVLPLLQSLVADGLISARDFYGGYGAAQAVPGPLFTFAAFLGYANHSPLHGLPGAFAATVLIFVPSFLLVVAVWPIFGAVRANRAAAGALRGANASVVGLLGALLYSPLLLGLGTSLPRITIALGVFMLVTVWKTPPWIAVALAAATGLGLALSGSFA